VKGSSLGDGVVHRYIRNLKKKVGRRGNVKEIESEVLHTYEEEKRREGE
jgi:hypothetical protein